MTNQQLINNGHEMMDETDQAIERSKKVSLFYQRRSSYTTAEVVMLMLNIGAL